MSSILENAYTEVNQIIELLGEEYRVKIPLKIQKLFQEKQNLSYKTNIKKNTPIDQMQISRDALIIISILNLKYWEVNESKKNELKKIYYQNERKFQEKVNAYKKVDWLKIQKNEIIKEENGQNMALVEIKGTSWLEKIKKFFINLIYIGREKRK